LPRSTYYYGPPCAETAENVQLMHQIDRIYTRRPDFGIPRMTDELRALGMVINHKRVARLMREMGLQSLLPGPHTSVPHPEHHIFPYLLRDREIRTCNDVWAADITYIPMLRGHAFLVAIMDWYSRYVLAWQLSRSLQTTFCVDALRCALARATPVICNTDQGAQFTSMLFTALLLEAGVAISMNGRGRARDNILVERLWRTVKYEHVYLYCHETMEALQAGLEQYFQYYNTERRHSSLGKQTPAQIYTAYARA